MKKYCLAVVFTFLCLSGAVRASEPSPQKILDSYRKAVRAPRQQKKHVPNVLAGGFNGTVAIGNTGAEASRSAGGDRPVDDSSKPGHFSLITASPDRLRIEIDIDGARIDQCYNGKSAWRRDSTGVATLIGSAADTLRLEAWLANNQWQTLSRSRVRMQYAGNQQVAGRPADGIEFTFNDARVVVFFDQATHLAIKQVNKTDDNIREIEIADGPASGDVLTLRLLITSNERTFNISVITKDTSAPIDAKAFAYPETVETGPAPDIAALIKAIQANQQKIEELREHYTFKQLETERVLGSDGRVKETLVKTYEVTPVAGSFVRRLVNDNGKTLSPSELEKEDKKVQKEVEDLIKRQEKREKKESQGEDDGQFTIMTFLRACEFTSVRHESLRGQRLIAFDFEPRKGFKPANRAESIANKLAGIAWVDEDARQIARMEAHLTDSFNVGGGLLASLKPSTAVIFEQRKIDGEVWLPAFAEVNISAKFLLFGKFNRAVTEQYSDYKKYRIDSDYKLTKPN